MLGLHRTWNIHFHAFKGRPIGSLLASSTTPPPLSILEGSIKPHSVLPTQWEHSAQQFSRGLAYWVVNGDVDFPR